jgi:hypothetical protein
MNERTSYIILPDLKLIIELFSNSTTINDAIELKKLEIKDVNYDASFNFIVLFINIDLRSTDITEIEIKKYVESIKSDKQIIGNRKSAIIAEKPNQVVLGTLYEMIAKELPMNFKIFSTIQAAMFWIGLSSEYESIVLKNIEVLKNNAT